MALADLLSLGFPGTSQAPQQPQLPDYTSGIMQSLLANSLQGAQQRQQVPAYHAPSKFRNTLGAIGDALMVGAGGKPLYHERMQQQQTQAALQGFLTNPDAAIAQLMQVDAPSGIALYKALHPASETPVGVKEYEYEQKLPQTERPAFEKMLQLTHPGMMAPYVMPEGGGQIETPGGGLTPGQVVNGFRFKGGNPNDKNSWEATGSGPSQTFPGR